MTEIKKINIRLDLSKETPRRAWEYLQALDRKKFRSYSQIISVALVEYFDRAERSGEAAETDRRKREEDVAERILARMEDSVGKNLSDIVNRCLTDFFASRPLPEPNAIPEPNAADDPKAERKPENAEIPYDLIDWDFLGS